MQRRAMQSQPGHVPKIQGRAKSDTGCTEFTDFILLGAGDHSFPSLADV